jgi:hypothetical protein
MVTVQEAGEIFNEIHKQIHDGIKKQMDNGSTSLNEREAIVMLQHDFKIKKTSSLILE